jgi:hypothetical protein
MPMLLLSRGQDYQDMHQCSDVTICDLFPKLFLSSRQNPVTKIGIVYDRLSKRATVTNPLSKLKLRLEKSRKTYLFSGELLI